MVHDNFMTYYVAQVGKIVTISTIPWCHMMGNIQTYLCVGLNRGQVAPEVEFSENYKQLFVLFKFLIRVLKEGGFVPNLEVWICN